MRKHRFLCFGFSLLFFTSVFGETYKSRHVIIESDLDPLYVQYIQANAGAFYATMKNQYFRKGGKTPLTIYYSKTQSDTFKLLRQKGHKNRAHKSYYVSKEAAIYTHRFTKQGGTVRIGTLFHEITHHFVRANFKDPPTWFNEGLACFFGDETRIVKGKLMVGEPSPRRQRELKERIEKGARLNLKRLFGMTQKELYNWPVGYELSWVLLYWLYENGKFGEYLQNVQKNGFEIWVLEQTLNKPVNEINRELLAYIKKDCYAGAYLRDGQRTRNNAQKKEAFLKALELKPDYKKAQFELALCYYRDKDYEKCKEYLRKILRSPETIECRSAAEQMGRCYYREKDYAQALEYFQKALEYSDYYEYKFGLYYWIANCHHYLKDHSTAKEFYKVFLNNNWEPEKHEKRVTYAKEYQTWNEGNNGEKKASSKQKKE